MYRSTPTRLRPAAGGVPFLDLAGKLPLSNCNKKELAEASSTVLNKNSAEKETHSPHSIINRSANTLILKAHFLREPISTTTDTTSNQVLAQPSNRAT